MACSLTYLVKEQPDPSLNGEGSPNGTLGWQFYKRYPNHMLKHRWQQVLLVVIGAAIVLAVTIFTDNVLMIFTFCIPLAIVVWLSQRKRQEK